ncbi:hypothetical protein SAMN04487770_12816 [Butyrivibrio sp. ob235]|uniref:hypothetical protein n=1 Tax=Butyrivibrio sp. ob235 TaxID=1761780 RepID=UPI0008D0964E|nr:hypothetical protein [Butyrivibrio sp. ob235]SEM18757.1 hypothetical protein SAMN04487770_12816 [Butyrivibrio sp. ob235]
MRNNYRHKYSEDSLAFYLDLERNKFKKHVKHVLSEMFYGEADLKMLAMPITMEPEELNILKTDLQELLAFYESLDKRIALATDDSRFIFEDLQNGLSEIDLEWLIDASSDGGFIYELVNYCIEDKADQILEEKYSKKNGYSDPGEHMGDAFSESVDVFQKMATESSLDADQYFDYLNSIPELLKECLNAMAENNLVDSIRYDRNLNMAAKTIKESTPSKEPTTIQKVTVPDSDSNVHTSITDTANKGNTKDDEKSQNAFDSNIVMMLKRGAKYVSDRAKLREYLAQNLKDDKLHLNLLIFAYVEGFLPQIYKAANKQETAQVYADRMINHYGVTRENANWSISAWCQMFGYVVELMKDNFDHSVKNDSGHMVELGIGIYRCGVDLEPGEHAIVVDWNTNSKYKTHELWCKVSDDLNSGFSGGRIEFRDKCYIKISNGEYLKIGAYGSENFEDILRITATKV